ncbi:MAG: hypothetical protein ACYS8X_06485 [Planctomycetota bacterium]|jgi:hypothetical protein
MSIAIQQSPATRPAVTPLSSGVDAKLKRLRRAIRFRLTAEGVAWLAVTVVALVLTTLALDYLLRLDRPQRALVMLGAAAAVAASLWVHLIRPSRARLRRGDLAVLVERRHGHLQSRLISAIEFAARPLPDGVSAAMARRSVEEANALTADLAFDGIVERRSLWRVVRVAICAVAVLVGFGFWQGELLRLWAARNLALADVPWPQRTYLTIADGKQHFVILRGEDLEVLVKTTRGSVAPAHVTIHARYPSVGWTEDKIEPTDADGRNFQVVFRAVTEPFEFYVTGGDDVRDRRRPHEVRLVEPPALASVRFTIDYPPYTGRPSITADGSSGVLPVPTGGALRFQATATKDLAGAKVELTGEGIHIVQPVRVEPAAGSAEKDHPRRLAGQIGIDVPNVAQTLHLRFDLTDTEGYTNRRGGRYVLRVQIDLPPVIEMKKTGVGQAVTPNAMIPLMLRGKDDSGIAGVTVGVSRSDQPDHVSREPVAVPPSARPPASITAEHTLDLMGRNLKPGQTIAIQAQAADILPAELGGPNLTRSGVISLRLVDPADLLTELIARQKTLRIEFLEALAQQDMARTQSEAASAAADKAIGPAALNALTESAGIQRAVRAEVVKAAEKLALIADEMTYNRLGDPADIQAIRSEVVAPLGDVSRTIAMVLAQMQAAGELTAAEAFRDQLDDVAARQRDIRKQMEAILARMAQLQSRQDLANELQKIVNWAEESLEKIRRKQEEEIGELLD